MSKEKIIVRPTRKATIKDYMSCLNISRNTAVEYRKQDRKGLRLPKHRPLTLRQFITLYDLDYDISTT